MKISIGVDHGALNLRKILLEYLQKAGHEIFDHGTFTENSVDYPDFALAVAQDIANLRADFGILCCTTGIGMSIAANKVDGARAAMIHHEDEASLSRRHNNANIICFGGYHTTGHEAKRLVDIFINESFEGGRHERRVNKFCSWEG